MNNMELNQQLIRSCDVWVDNSSEIKELISKGTNVNYYSMDPNFNSRMSRCKCAFDTPLMSVLNSRSGIERIIDRVKILLESGANAALIGRRGCTPLSCAIRIARKHYNVDRKVADTQVELVKLLVSHLKKEDLNVMFSSERNPNYQLTALELAISSYSYYSQSEIAKILLDAGADPNIGREGMNRFLENMIKYSAYSIHKFTLFPLLLAKGLILDEEYKQILEKDHILKFFTQHTINGLFQNVVNEETLSKLNHVKRSLKNKLQKLAYSLWLNEGIDEIIKPSRIDAVKHFLMEKTGKDLYPPSTVLSSYLGNCSIRNLIFLLIEGLESLSEYSLNSKEFMDSYVFHVVLKRNNLNDCPSKYKEHLEILKLVGNYEPKYRKRNSILSEEVLENVRYLYQPEFVQITTFRISDQPLYQVGLVNSSCLTSGAREADETCEENSNRGFLLSNRDFVADKGPIVDNRPVMFTRHFESIPKTKAINLNLWQRFLNKLRNWMVYLFNGLKLSPKQEDSTQEPSFMSAVAPILEAEPRLLSLPPINHKITEVSSSNRPVFTFFHTPNLAMAHFIERNASSRNVLANK